MPLYGRDAWDPRLICAQIAVVQCVHYLTWGGLYALCHLVFGTRLHLDLFFAWETVTVTDAPGWMVVVNSLIVAALGAATLLVVVERAKKCFDFAFTTYFLHWLVTLFYSGFPSSWSWWVVTSLCIVIMSVGGEQLCMKIEMSEINLGGAGGFITSAAGTGSGGGGKGGDGGAMQERRGSSTALPV